MSCDNEGVCENGGTCEIVNQNLHTQTNGTHNHHHLHVSAKCHCPYYAHGLKCEHGMWTTTVLVEPSFNSDFCGEWLHPIIFATSIDKMFWLKLIKERTICKSNPFWVIWDGLHDLSQIGASQIEAPIGSLFQNYVSSSFMVKMRIDLGPFGLFWFILGWG